MLALVVGTVADPHGLGTFVAFEVVEDLLVEVALAVDAVHDLKLLVPFGHIRDEPEEVVGLPVEAERVQAPQGERGVADPAEAVVPVALAARRLGQRGGGRGHQGTCGGEGESLQRQGAALEIPPPRVVGEVAPGQPVLPVVGRPDQPAAGLLGRERRLVLAPGEGAEADVAVLHEGPGHGSRPLEPQPQVGGERQLQIDALGRGHALVVRPVGVGPPGRTPAVVEEGLAVEGDLHLAGDAADAAQQDVVGVVVGRRPAVGLGAVVQVVPRPD